MIGGVVGMCGYLYVHGVVCVCVCGKKCVCVCVRVGVVCGNSLEFLLPFLVFITLHDRTSSMT